MNLPENILAEVERYVREKKLGKKEREKVLRKVSELYEKSKYEYNEPIGVITAQSLSEPATQMTMRTYHFAGTAGIQVTLGLPRIIEIYDAKKEPETPSMTIRLKKEWQEEEKVLKVARKLKEMRFSDFVSGYIIDLTEPSLTFKINVEKLKLHELDMERLSKKISIRNVNVEVEGDRVKVILREEDVEKIYTYKQKIMDTYVKGIRGVTQVIIDKDEHGEWVISTLGSNLKRVFAMEGVDWKRTYSNNIFEVYNLLGIEAARNLIIREAIKTMEEQGLGVDIRYITLSADLMTFSGKVMGIGRYGIAGHKESVLARMAFEEAKKHIVDAGVNGYEDNLRGLVENVMMNQVAPLGTGAFVLKGKVPELKKKSDKDEKKR